MFNKSSFCQFSGFMGMLRLIPMYVCNPNLPYHLTSS